MKKWRLVIVAALVLLLAFFTQKNRLSQPTFSPSSSVSEQVVSDSKEVVAAYIHEHKKLPEFYMTKNEARKKGWSNGALDTVLKGRAIGGDRFGNFEGTLPDNWGPYYECDIDTIGRKKRGEKRIIFNKKGSVWYTDDHYEHFDQLYKGA